MVVGQRIKQVHPIPHDKAGASLLMTALLVSDSISAAEGRLHLLQSLLHLTLQICYCALYPVGQRAGTQTTLCIDNVCV